MVDHIQPLFYCYHLIVQTEILLMMPTNPKRRTYSVDTHLKTTRRNP